LACSAQRCGTVVGASTRGRVRVGRSGRYHDGPGDELHDDGPADHGGADDNHDGAAGHDDLDGAGHIHDDDEHHHDNHGETDNAETDDVDLLPAMRPDRDQDHLHKLRTTP
jgi:hypothetical protein